MEVSAHRLEALAKLRERLHTETEPGKLYKTLKELSSLPILGDILAEIGFRQTIKLLRKEQLLVAFAKDLAAQWSERSPWERQPEAEPQDSALHMRLTPEQAPREPAEDEAHEPAASRERGEDAREVVGGSSRSPQPNPDLYPAGSFEACLNYDCPSSSSSTLSPGKRKKRKRPLKAEAQSHGAKVPRSKSPNCKALNLLPASGLPGVSSSRQACFPRHGQDSSSLHSEREAAPWACRMNLKTPVYSGPAPAHRLLPEWHRGCLAKPDCSRQTAEEQECRPQIRTGQPPQAQTESQTHLQLQEARELRLQALRDRIQRAQAKKTQARQTMMIAFPAQVASQRQQAASGPGAEASSKENSLPGVLDHAPLQRAPRLPLGPSNKTQLKKRAPLMAKSLRDYKNTLSRR